jgi:CheY-like chemotaxis protein
LSRSSEPTHRPRGIFNQQIAQEMLEEMGAAVCLASNGAAALALLRETRVDCIPVALQMPVMDGLEATRRIRAAPQLSHIPVLANRRATTGTAASIGATYPRNPATQFVIDALARHAHNAGLVDCSIGTEKCSV